MDKDILRLVIIVVGALVITGMVLWSLFKNKKKRRDISFYDRGNPLDKIDESLILKTENDDFDVVPLGSVLNDDFDVDPISAIADQNVDDSVEQVFDELAEPETLEEGINQGRQVHIPALIQFSIVARADEGFNGADLVAAFNQVGLKYGSMQVYERVDENRMVDFAVASMVEPGTFPNEHVESFYCPGLVFFMQPMEVKDALSVFDDFIRTIDFLASELDGVKWDHQRQPLSKETVESFRKQLGATIAD
jgi:cell division protein ZipA